MRVINYFPRYSGNPTSDQYEDYCRVRLMLHHPFGCPTDLLSFDGHHYDSYATAFYAYVRLYTHLDDYYTDVIPDDPDAVESEYEESDCGKCNGPLADFEAFAR